MHIKYVMLLYKVFCKSWHISCNIQMIKTNLNYKLITNN